MYLFYRFILTYVILCEVLGLHLTLVLISLKFNHLVVRQPLTHICYAGNANSDHFLHTFSVPRPSSTFCQTCIGCLPLQHHIPGNTAPGYVQYRARALRLTVLPPYLRVQASQMLWGGAPVVSGRRMEGWHKNVPCTWYVEQ